MKNLKNVKMFIFNFAKYRLSDGTGDEILLNIDYKNNKYSVENLGQVLNDEFRQEVHQVALDLLQRKHAVNFAKKD